MLTAQRGQIEGLVSLFALSEYLLALLLIWLAIAGPGLISLDALIARRHSKQQIFTAAPPYQPKEQSHHA